MEIDNLNSEQALEILGQLNIKIKDFLNGLVLTLVVVSFILNLKTNSFTCTSCKYCNPNKY